MALTFGVFQQFLDIGIQVCRDIGAEAGDDHLSDLISHDHGVGSVRGSDEGVLQSKRQITPKACISSRRKPCISSIPKELHITNGLPLYIIIAKEDTAYG